MPSFARSILVLCAMCAACSGTDTPNADVAAKALAFATPTTVSADCESCYEPAVVVDRAGRIYVTATRLFGVAVSSDDGRSFTLKPVPPPPTTTPFAFGEGDAIVNVAPWGTLYYTALWGYINGLPPGVQFAASDDGGDTWDVQFIHASTHPESRGFFADRQWLAFAGDSTIYLVFNCGFSTTICSLRSDDRGKTWGPAVDVVLAPDHTYRTPTGAPVVDADGALIVPYFSDPDLNDCLGARTVKVAASTDRGQSFTQHTVYTHAPNGGTCQPHFWPAATVLTDGAWVVGWSTADDRLWLSASRDGGATWSEPSVLTAAQTGGDSTSHPWLSSRADGGFNAVWFGPGPSVRLGRFTRDLALVGLATVPEIGGGLSEYPYLAHLPRDRAATVYLTPGGHLRFAATNL